MRSKRHPTPEKLTVQLVPSNDEVSARLVSAGHNPKLQLTLKSKKSMASIVEHLNSKWTAPGGAALSDTPLRLYVPDKVGHIGYGVDSQEVTIVSVFHAMNCPAICRLEYNWDPDHGAIGDANNSGLLPGHEHQELQSTSDDGSSVSAGDEQSSDSHHSNASRSSSSHAPASSAPTSTNTRTRGATSAAATRSSSSAAHPSTASSTQAPNSAHVASPNTRQSTQALSSNASHALPTRHASNSHNAGSSSAASSGSNTSPRSTSVNRLAVPENLRGSSKALSEDALDDDAVRQGLLMRKASKVAKGGNSNSYKPSSPGSSPKSSPTRASRASPPHHNALASRATRYSMRVRRGSTSGNQNALPGTSVAHAAHPGSAQSHINAPSNHGNAMRDAQQHESGSHMMQTVPSHHGHHHQAHQMGQHHMQQQMMFNSNTGDSSMMSMYGGSADDMIGADVDLYGEPRSAHELEQLEAMPAMEYGFGATYVDTPFGENLPSTSASRSHMHQQAGAHLGVGGMPHLQQLQHQQQQHSTMVVNNHYYQPTWDHSQSYFLGNSTQAPVDPYYAAYPAANHSHSHAGHSSSSNAANNNPQGSYYAQQDYFQQDFFPTNPRSNGQGFYHSYGK